MPFWKDYVHTKPEVDDDDLPLPEHRIFDDDGYLKEKVEKAVAAALRASLGQTANAKKSPQLSPKRRAELLKSVGAKPTTPLKVADPKAEVSTAGPAPSAVRSRVASHSRSPSVRKSGDRAQLPAATPTAASTPRRASPAQKPTTKKVATPEKTLSRSPDRKRTRSPSPTQPKASPKAATAKRSRSRPKSGSQKAKRAAPSKTPSPKWTLAALKEFAKDNSISLKGATKKAEILDAIANSAEVDKQM